MYVITFATSSGQQFQGYQFSNKREAIGHVKSQCTILDTEDGIDILQAACVEGWIDNLILPGDMYTVSNVKTGEEIYQRVF